MNNKLLDNLNEIIENKLELFKELYDITLLQQQDIENNDADNIQALVEEKQQVINEIDELDKSFLEGYKTLKESLNLESLHKVDTEKYPELKNLKNSVEKIVKLAPDIMELENSNRERLNEIYERVKGELKQINSGKRSLKAYEAAPVHNDGVFIDKKK